MYPNKPETEMQPSNFQFQVRYRPSACKRKKARAPGFKAFYFWPVAALVAGSVTPSTQKKGLLTWLFYKKFVCGVFELPLLRNAPKYPERSAFENQFLRRWYALLGRLGVVTQAYRQKQLLQIST
jgi:hypothetical protein